jgi:hypothetical protein
MKLIKKEMYECVRKGADKSLAFPICITTKEFFFDWLNKLEQ